jgi:LmbE family N-acetylglucosaminyl deacetylase
VKAPKPDKPEVRKSTRVAVIVAHPDDETLWAGGLLLSHPEWSPFILALCRRDDPDRAPRFRQALDCLDAEGALGNLDDGPEQVPLATQRLQDSILTLLPRCDFDLLLTHAPQGEYTWHRRHGEVSLAVRNLWRDGRLSAGALWQFAYEDGGGTYAPRPRPDSSFELALPEWIWSRKYSLVTEVYGFGATSWEARAATRTEAFHCFTDREATHPLTHVSQTGGL